ncbi:hypothetical protein [Halobaculum gomorrense]|uniref:N-acetyltransferase domain-containing protein n=1 Tax=Halobaculum gomorrense TaxID=43928 RepID=A0A1M5SWZ0_9EURY|nr:hypothetical protein [Halobaculum gomorrense]SHH42748.1 hypothetical protein SAMN05443636_2549 [Halobaculum gomorrense]
MHVRDAVEADAEALAAIADAPSDAMRGLVHDRTVRVAVEEAAATDPNEDVDADPDDLLGFVSFDVRGDTVHVTQFGGTREAAEQLLAEPLRFAATEEMAVELLVIDGEDGLRAAAERAGFEAAGPGPQFEGKATTRYRVEEA